MTARFRYDLAAPRVLSEAHSFRLRSMRVAFDQDGQNVEIIGEVLDAGGTVVTTVSFQYTMDSLDAFIRTAAALPGAGFEDKLISALAQFDDRVPPGGTLVDVGA